LIYVFSSSGELEDKIDMEDIDISNLCFGGPDNRTLYVTESDMGRVAAIEWHTTGMTLFPARGVGGR
jgi:gluconolactonase